eukprot:scaffold3964_cov336-Prasinococcus_capsulatus_cf.AAC.4
MRYSSQFWLYGHTPCLGNLPQLTEELPDTLHCSVAKKATAPLGVVDKGRPGWVMDESARPPNNPASLLCPRDRHINAADVAHEGAYLGTLAHGAASDCSSHTGKQHHVPLLALEGVYGFL